MSFWPGKFALNLIDSLVRYCEYPVENAMKLIEEGVGRYTLIYSGKYAFPTRNEDGDRLTKIGLDDYVMYIDHLMSDITAVRDKRYVFEELYRLTGKDKRFDNPSTTTAYHRCPDDTKRICDGIVDNLSSINITKIMNYTYTVSHLYDKERMPKVLARAVIETYVDTFKPAIKIAKRDLDISNAVIDLYDRHIIDEDDLFNNIYAYLNTVSKANHDLAYTYIFNLMYYIRKYAVDYGICGKLDEFDYGNALYNVLCRNKKTTEEEK